MELTKEEIKIEKQMDSFIGALFQKLDESGFILTTYPGNDNKFLLTHCKTGMQKAFSFDKWHDMMFSKISKIKQ